MNLRNIDKCNKWSQSDIFVVKKIKNAFEMKTFNISWKSWESAVRDCCEICSCKNLIKDNTCFKNQLKPSCIDLIITSDQKAFKVLW